MRFASPLRHHLAASLPLALVMAMIFALLGAESEILATFRVHKAYNDATRQLMFWVTDYANFAIYAVYLCFLVWAVRQKRSGAVRMVIGFAVIQFVVSFGVVTLLKVALGRPRPEADSAFWDLWTFNSYYHSLPSGHTAEIFGAVLPLVLFFRRWPVTICLGLAAALVGFSRIYLHQHYPTDVMFGWLLGSYVGWATYAYWDHVRQTSNNTGAQPPKPAHGYKPHE